MPGPADLAHPLPLLKAQMNAVFDQAQAQINRDRAVLPPASSWAALPQLLRNSLACLLLAVAFAGFARRSESDIRCLWKASASCSASQGVKPERACMPTHPADSAPTVEGTASGGLGLRAQPGIGLPEEIRLENPLAVEAGVEGGCERG